MRTLFVVLVVLAAVVLALPYLVLPTFFESLVARDVQSRLGLDEAPAVELQSDPQWEMLLGEFSGGRISARDLELGGVAARSAAIDVDRPFSIDVPASVGNRVIVPEGGISGRLRLEIPGSEVSRLVRSNTSVPVNGVELRNDGVRIDSETTALGTTIPISVEGDLGVSGGDLAFEPRTLEAAGTPVPDFLADDLLAGSGFSYPLDELPYGATITGVESVPGAVVLTGRVSDVDLGAPPAG